MGGRVSVIIPVYQAAAFVEEAAASALAQPETLEVLLIEDGSSDNSLDTCRELAAKHVRVRLLQHANGRHLGVTASRNLGIESAQAEYVAFLDADDWCLPGRFAASVPLLDASPEVDGVYEAVGTAFDDPLLERDWYARGGKPIVTLQPPVPPEHLLETLMSGARGSFCTDGILVRRSVFEKTGLFEPLGLGQDTAMWWKMAASCRLVGGNVATPVATYRRHAGCRSSLGDEAASESPARAACIALEWAERNGLREARRALRAGLAQRIRGPAAGRTRVLARLRQLGRFFQYWPRVPDLILERALWRLPARWRREASVPLVHRSNGDGWPPPPSVIGVPYWRARARAFGACAVLNLAHAPSEAEEVTRRQKELLFKPLRGLLRGDERLALDLGCGPGRFTRDLAALIGAPTLGVDPVEEFVSQAPRKGAVAYTVATAECLPIRSCSTDLVWICLVLGFITDEQRLENTAREIERILSKDGLLFLVENTNPSPDRPHMRFRTPEAYRSLFAAVRLLHVSDYVDAGERISVLAGRRNA